VGKTLSIDDLTTSLGLSRAAVWNRINLLREVLEEKKCFRRGPNNAIMLTGEGLQLLRVMQDRISEGLTMKQAVEEIKRELGFVSKKEARRDPLAMKLEMVRRQVTAVEEKVNDLDRRVDALEAREFPEGRMLPARVLGWFRKRTKPKT